MKNVRMGINQKHAIPLLLGIIVFFYLYNGVQYLQAQSITSDEGSFYNYAVRYLRGVPQRVHPVVDNSKMPIVALNTIPRIVENIVQPGKQKTDMGVSDLLRGRYVTLFFSVSIILLVFTWSSQLYGKKAGLFAAFLFSFCPNNMAAATLVTTDSYSTFFLLFCMYLLWKFCNTASLKYFLLLSFAVACSQLVKQSLFHLYILVPLSIFVYFFFGRQIKPTFSFLKLTLLFCVINLLLVNAGYYFNQSFLPLGDYAFMSDLFRSVQNVFPQWLPMPFPKPFVDGLDMAKYYDQIGGGINQVSSFGKVTIAGKSFTGEGVWYYYIVSILFKTPLSYFFLLLIAVFGHLRSVTRTEFIKNEFFLLLPVVYFLVLMSFFYQTQCGIRHVIFIYPFLFIYISRIVSQTKHVLTKSVIVLLCFFLIGSVLKYYRNYYPYTNELIRDKTTAYQFVGAANLDFMHGQLFHARYLQEHKEVQWATKNPQAGFFLITVEDYMDIWNRYEYAWISRFKPFGHVGHSGLLIKVTSSELKEAGLIK